MAHVDLDLYMDNHTKRQCHTHSQALMLASISTLMQMLDVAMA